MPAPQTILVLTKPVTNAGASIATMNLAITTQDAASKNKCPANAAAAGMWTATTKYSAAAMFLSTTVKLAAEKNLNTMMWTNAELARDGCASSNASTFLNTIGNISAAKKAAPHLALDNLDSCW